MECRHWKAAAPTGLVIDSIEVGLDRILVTAHPCEMVRCCLDCGCRSGQVHSRCERHLLDLPSHGRSVHLRLGVRRFRCGNAACPRQTFAEQLGDAVAPKAARRTSRLEDIVHCLAVALGGRPSAGLARRLMLPVSKDTLLRTVRRIPVRASPLHVIGIDDWVCRRHHRYGTIICDLERRRVVDLLPDREVGTVETWLARHPGITTIARDRAGGYAQAARKALPDATQVADRWHLMENASAAFLEAVHRSMPALRGALGCRPIDAELLTAAERLQYDRFLRRDADAEAIRALSRAGAPIRRLSAAPAGAASWCAALSAARQATHSARG